MVKTKSLYGFSPRLRPFVGKTEAEQVKIMQSWGCTAVFGGYNNPEFIQAAHNAGMAVYAEFGCFVGADLWRRYPASRPVAADGSLIEPDGPYWGVNPAVTAVQRDRLEALETLLIAHPVDGVWLDFIRWPCHWEVLEPALLQTSFDAETLARFSEETRVSLPEGATAAVARAVLQYHAAAWTSWRCQQITSWVAEARRVIEHVRPGALLGLFGVPWRLSDYDGAILNIVGQDYRALGDHVDIFSPMVYHRMCGFDPPWIGSVTEEVHTLTGKPVWPIVQSVNDPSPLSAEEYGEALAIALESPASEGVLVYTMEAALAPAKLEVTKARFTA